MMIAVVFLLLLSCSLVQGAKAPNCTTTFDVPAYPCKMFCVTKRLWYIFPLGKIVNRTDYTQCKRFISGIEGRCEKGRCVMGGIFGMILKMTPLKRFG
uniref:Putative secreted protein n=1 Tax=Amblyomma aureolatum TaxID=187763 RepID=A0A1E1WWW3_9ACAR